MKNSIYHAHEVNKTIKKHGKNLYTARLCKSFGDTAISKCEVSKGIYQGYFCVRINGAVYSKALRKCGSF
jgi:hypothetical protein